MTLSEGNRHSFRICLANESIFTLNPDPSTGGCNLQVAGCRLQVAGAGCRCRCRLQVAGCRLYT